MSYDYQHGCGMWRTPEALHLDVRGLDPPQPMLRILGLIERLESDDVLIIHLDREPIFLYPELDDRGWSYEVVSPACGDPDCEDEVRLRLVRLSP